MVDHIDISPLYSERIPEIPDTIDALNSHQKTALFRNTDLYLQEDGTLLSARDPASSGVSFRSFIDLMEVVRGFDANQDQKLDRDEIKKLSKTFLKDRVVDFQETAETADARSVELLMHRYSEFLKNWEQLRSELSFKPLIDILKVYNYGLYLDDVRQAKAPMQVNGLTKAVGNILTFIPYNFLYRPFGHAEKNWMLMDDVAQTAAQQRYQQRALAKQQSLYGGRREPKRQPNRNFSRALPYGVRRHAINTDQREQQRDHAQRAEQLQIQPVQ